MKLLCVVGARPNFIKLAPLLNAARNYPDIKITVVHTGQHYDYNMSKVFFRDLNIPNPDVHLGVGSGSHSYQTGQVMIGLEKEVLKIKPDIIVVIGDVNSTLAGALVATKLVIPLAHIEAGLRSFDRTMPEEINRVVTDNLSELLFAPGENAVRNLIYEGIPRRKIFSVGNIMIDALKQYLPLAKKSRIKQFLNLPVHNYGVITLHRAGNVDDRKIFTGIIKGLTTISKEIPIIFPIHPRTKKQLKLFRLEKLFKHKSILLIEPVGYLDSINLLMNARLVLTDSGGVQEETTFLGVPCLTLRNETEWGETIKQGTNLLVGTKPEKIIREVYKILKQNKKSSRHIPLNWDGKTADRFLKVISKWHKNNKQHKGDKK